MLRPYIPFESIASGLPISRWRRNFHLRHHPIGKPGRRRKLRKLDQLKNDFALPVRFDAAQGAISEVNRSVCGEEPLRPELDFIGCEMHGEVSHWESYGVGLGRVSLTAVFQVDP